MIEAQKAGADPARKEIVMHQGHQVQADESPREIEARARSCLEELARQAGLVEVDEGVWGPCPICGVYALKIVLNRPDDPFFLCKQRHDHTPGERYWCYFGAGIAVLRSWLRKGWRVGRPLPPSKSVKKKGSRDRAASATVGA